MHPSKLAALICVLALSPLFGATAPGWRGPSTGADRAAVLARLPVVDAMVSTLHGGLLEARMPEWFGDSIERYRALSAELRCEHLRPPLDLERHRGQPHLLGAALEIASGATTDAALLDELAPAVLAGEDSGDPEARRAYAASLLEEIDETLAEALLAEAAP